MHRAPLHSECGLRSWEKAALPLPWVQKSSLDVDGCRPPPGPRVSLLSLDGLLPGGRRLRRHPVGAAALALLPSARPLPLAVQGEGPPQRWAGTGLPSASTPWGAP